MEDPESQDHPQRDFAFPGEKVNQWSEGCEARLAGSYHSQINPSLERKASWSSDRVPEGKFYEVVCKPKLARGCRKTIAQNQELETYWRMP